MKDRLKDFLPLLLAGVFLVIALLLTNSCEGAWYYVKPVRNPTDQGFLGSIYSRMPSSYAATYRDADLSTSAHEGSHGLNALLRNDPQRGWSATTHQACFVPDFSGDSDGQAWIGKQPHGVTLAEIARYCRGTTSPHDEQLYLFEMQKYWNQQPLFIFDELCAYCNSAYVQIQYGNPNPTQLSHDVQLARAMLGWCNTIIQLAQQKGNDTKDLQEFIQWMGKYVSFLERSIQR